MRYRCLLVATLRSGCAGREPAGRGRSGFRKVYKKDYLDNNADKEFAEEVSKPPNSCLVCHQG